jgi:hypothetical protein
MTLNKPIPADSCQTEKILPCVELQTPLESGKSMQETAAESPTQNLVSKEVSVRVRPPEPLRSEVRVRGSLRFSVNLT